MQTFEDLFDSEALRLRADLLLEELLPEEREQWLKHSCTQYLLLTLKGDYLDYHNAWETGVFTESDADGTVQQNSKALGALDAIRKLADGIEDIKHYDKDERLQDTR